MICGIKSNKMRPLNMITFETVTMKARKIPTSQYTRNTLVINKLTLE